MTIKENTGYLIPPAIGIASIRINGNLQAKSSLLEFALNE